MSYTLAENCQVVQDLGDGARLIQHPSGQKFRYNPNHHEPGAFDGMQCVGNRLEDAQYIDVESLRKTISAMHIFGEDKVISGRTGKEFGEDKNGAFKPFYKEVYDMNTGEHINNLSSEYRILQNQTLFGTLADVADSAKLTPIGRVDVGERGFTLGYTTFMNPEFTINILEQYPEPVALGVEFRNSFGGQMGASAQCFGIQMICSNFNLWGQTMPRFWIPHDSKQIDSVPDIVTSYLEGVISGIPTLSKFCSDAESDLVAQTDVMDILWGADMPIKIIEAIGNNPVDFNVRLAKNPYTNEARDLTMFQLYSCATNAISFRESKSYRTSLSYTEGALKLLTMKQDKLIEMGRARAEAYNDIKAKAKVKRDQARLILDAQKVA